MVSNFPRLFEASDPLPAPRPVHTSEPDGLGGRVFDRLREAFCSLHGHDDLLQFQPDRLYLKCVSCGHESPGWELNETPPTPMAIHDTHRPAVVRPQLISSRRIA
jgi:hypothetical protein